MDINDVLRSGGGDAVRAVHDSAERYKPRGETGQMEGRHRRIELSDTGDLIIDGHVAYMPDIQIPPERPEERYVDNARAAEKKAAAMEGDKRGFNWAKNSRTAAQLSNLDIPDVRWIIARFLPEGVAILAGKPKGGKSWMALEWCIAIASGTPIFGGTIDITPRDGDALYLALEDNNRRLKARLAKLCLKSPARLTLVSMTDKFPRMNEGGLAAIEEWLIAHPQARLIAIDTLAKFRPQANAKKGAYDQDYDAITPLLTLAHKYSIAVLIIHHQRKMSSDDPFDSVSGTLGLTGAVDTLMLLDRRDSGMVFCIKGRDVEDDELAMQFDKETAKWRVLGSVQDVQRTATDTAIVETLYDAFKEAGSDDDTALTVTQIKQRAGIKMKVNSLRKHLGRLADRGLIRRAERGRFCSA